MPLMIVGTIVISLGAWSVVSFEWAHTIIYVGSVLVMLAALMLVIFGWDKLIRDRLAEQGIEKANFIQKIKALLHDPLKFGATWQMVFMNFTVSGVGIFMAAKLDEIFRVWPHREERIILTGHWHILSGIIATIILFYYADLAGLKGKAPPVVWLGRDHRLRSGLWCGDHLLHETAVRDRIGPAAAGQLDHAAGRYWAGAGAGGAGDAHDVASG